MRKAQKQDIIQNERINIWRIPYPFLLSPYLSSPSLSLPLSHTRKELTKVYTWTFLNSLSSQILSLPGRVQCCLLKDQRDFEVLLHSLYHIKGKF